MDLLAHARLTVRLPLLTRLTHVLALSASDQGSERRAPVQVEQQLLRFAAGLFLQE
jgi:hypothetical protein